MDMFTIGLRFGPAVDTLTPYLSPFSYKQNETRQLRNCVFALRSGFDKYVGSDTTNFRIVRQTANL